MYLFRDARGKVLYVGKAKSIRKRVASHFSNPSTRGGHGPRRPDRPDRGAGGAHRRRGAARGAELHQAVQAALQHPPARRQVVPVHRDQPRRGLPAGVLHARAPPARPRLLRPVQQRQAGALDARGARQGVHVPLLRGPEARAAQRLAVPRLLHQALRGPVRRLCQQGGLPPRDRRRDRLPVRPLPRDRARARGVDARGGRRAALRGRRPGAQPAARRALAARAPAGRARDRNARRDRGGGPRGRGQRAGLPGPRRRPVGPTELLPRQRGAAAMLPTSPRRSSSSTTPAR